MQKYIMAMLLMTLTLLAVPFAAAQEQAEKPAPADEGEIIMLEEIVIHVAPELPTVVVTIPRQKPEIKPVTIQSPDDRMAKGDEKDVKPNLADMKVKKIEESRKMLAKQREQ